MSDDADATQPAALTTAALQFHDVGTVVIPVRGDGTKAPAVNWRPIYRREQPSPSREQVEDWATRHHGIGILTGAVSGQMEMFELEGRAVDAGLLPELLQLANAAGLGELLQQLLGGYLERTPSGGIHILYRVTDAPARPNTKLARRPSTPEELAAWKAAQQASVDAEQDENTRAKRQRTLDGITRGEQVPQVLIETRGEGGFVVTAPSAGPVHDTGRPWELLAGGPATIPTITGEQRDALYEVAAVLDRMPPPPEPIRFLQPGDDREHTAGGISPGDDYEARTDWSEILGPYGWTLVTAYGKGRFWRRPGKRAGISASTGMRDDRDRLYVFTTSTEFDAEVPYTKFGAYALLHHSGDHSAAARALHTAGYGQPAPEPSRPVLGPQPVPTGLGVDGNLATVTHLNPDQSRPLTVVEERTYERSDDGAALALVDRFGDVIRYVPDRGRWLTWDGTRWRWEPSSGGLVREYAKRVARSLPEGEKAAENHKKRSLSAVGTSAMLAQAETDTRVVVSIDDLDNHPLELNTPGGIVNLETGELLPSDPARLHTRVTACIPDPDADLSLWSGFLAATFNSDDTLIAYLQRLVGYSSTGAVTKHVMPFAFGSGGNGKGVFLESLTAVLGDYATTAPSGFLMAKSNPSHETEIARLAGVRMVICSEVGEDDRFDEVRVKQLTGGDSLTARFMRADHFTFTPTHHLWLMGNHRPAVKSGGRAFWRRLRLIPFVHEVPQDQMIDDLQGILSRDHGPAVLAWIIRGAVEFAKGGLDEPESVKAATDEYEHDQDSVGQFIEEFCHIGGNKDYARTRVSKVREEYERFCFTEGENPVSAKALTTALARRGVDSVKGGKGARFYAGLTLLVPDEPPPHEPPEREAPPAEQLGWR
ncbi:MAG: phage/plasmid primase, P4 family [Actinoallomurus sp.]